MVNFKKPKYVRKYDFIRYFNRPNDEWFWPTQEILKKISIGSSDVEESEDGEEKEFDFYEYFLEKKSELEKPMDMDINDPKIIEGMLIDKKSKSFISKNYNNCIIFDFEKIFKTQGNHEEQAHRTLTILKENNNALLFQPTFIFNNLAIAKPDAIVKINNQITIIETKATSKTKYAHIFDVMYQAKIIEQTIINENIGKIFDIKLCLVNYELAKKNDVSFSFCEFSEIKKPTTEKSGKNEKEKYPTNLFSEEVLESKRLEKHNELHGIKFIDIFRNKYESCSWATEKSTLINEVFSDKKMSQILKELFTAEICENPKFLPSTKYSWIFKKAEHFSELRNFWKSNEQYGTMKYSGNLIKLSKQILGFEQNITPENSEKWILDSIKNNLLNETKAIKNFITRKYRQYSWKDFYFNEETKIEFSKIKNNKVYFDFESLNQAIRVVDDTTPFMQIVNQVSIIFEEDNRLSESNNILCDPQKMDVNFFKFLIDSLLPRNKPGDYSYIVYNKTFESTCLVSMANLIGEDKYFDKIKLIIDNIVDLADFFDIRKECSIINKDLFGFYSIKKVLPLIQENDVQSFDDAMCKDYTKLEQIQHGGHAQSFATRRFFNKISNEEWEAVSNNLKIYCENDVRAMIAINFFVKKIISRAIKNS